VQAGAGIVEGVRVGVLGAGVIEGVLGAGVVDGVPVSECWEQALSVECKLEWEQASSMECESAEWEQASSTECESRSAGNRQAPSMEEHESWSAGSRCH
jgi:hypothetical protein